MQNLTLNKPKPLLPNESNCLLAKQLNTVKSVAKNIFVTVGYRAEEVTNYLSNFPQVVSIHTGDGPNASALESPEISSIDSHILILTCDNPAEIDFVAVKKETVRYSDSSFLVPVELRTNQNALPGDRIFVADNEVFEIGAEVQSSFMASGWQFINPTHIRQEQIVLWDFKNVWSDLIQQRRLRMSSICADNWWPVDTPAQLQEWSNSLMKPDSK